MLDVWPPLPIVIHHIAGPKWGRDNIIAALEHNDRICQVSLRNSVHNGGKVLDAMQEPFTALTHPDNFLPVLK